MIRWEKTEKWERNCELIINTCGILKGLTILIILNVAKEKVG